MAKCNSHKKVPQKFPWNFPHVHHFSVWVYARAWIFPSNSLLVEVSPTSCDLNSRTFIIWTALSQESRDVVSEGMLGVPLWAPERGYVYPRWFPGSPASKSVLLTAALVLSTLPLPFSGSEMGVEVFQKVFHLCFNCLVYSPIWYPFPSRSISSLNQGSLQLPKDIVSYSTTPTSKRHSIVWLWIKHHIWWAGGEGGFLLRSHAPPPNGNNWSVHTLNPESLLRF